MKEDFGIREYLSLGYIYLLILGILSDSIYYHFLGINILDYSGLLDVLISPIVLLTTNLIVPVGLVVLVGISYLWTFRFSPRLHHRYRSKRWYQKLNNVEKLDKKYATPPSPDTIVAFFAIAVLIFFLGVGIGRGNKRRTQIVNNNIEVDHRILFQDGTDERIKLLGKNSLYLFYISEDETDVIISPIEYNVKKITKLKEEE